MAQHTTTKKSGKRLLLIIGIPLLIIGILITVAILGVNTFLKPTIKNALAKVVVDGSDSLYTFSLQDYSVGMGGSAVDLNNLNIQIDSARYQQLKAANNLPPVIFSVQLKKASIRGLKPWELWRKKNIICRLVSLDGANIGLLQQKNEQDSTPKKASETLFEAIQPDIKLIEVGAIEIKNTDVALTTLQRQTGKKDNWRLQKMNVRFSDILVDSVSHRDTTRILYAKNLEAGFDSLSIKSNSGIYSFAMGKTDYNFRERSLELNDFNMKPIISQAEFNRRKGHVADRFTIKAKKVAISELNIPAFVVSNRILAHVIAIEQPEVSIYKDKTAGAEFSNKRGKFPHQELLKASTDIGIDSVTLKNAQFTYTEKSLKTLKDGSIKFRGINGAITNISNQAEDIARNNWCKADLSADFMGNHKMRAVFSFDIGSTNGHYMVDANLASMQAVDISPLLRNLAAAELEGFNLSKFVFHCEGNDDWVTGNMQLHYKDLKLNVLRKDDDGSYKKKALMSFLANTLKLYSDNPSDNKERKATNIREPRVNTKNFFGIVVKNLMTCMLQIVVKGDNKSLPGLGGGGNDQKKEKAKKEDKEKDKKTDKKETDKKKKKD